jgi:phospholipid-binding lipoprotein MlaA
MDTLAYSAKRLSVLILCAMLSLSAGACAHGTPDDAMKATEISDPIEPVNRAVFAFNKGLDIAIIEPVAKVYMTIVPNFVRSGIQNFMRNLKSPLIVANDILQGNVREAGVATARFIINTTAGIGGLVDVAAGQGLAYNNEDLGQTLGVWGFGHGFYLVLPVIGPSSLRDVAGMTGDAYADPLRIWTFKTGRDWVYYTRNVVEGFDNRARLVKAVEDLRRNSLDYYAAVRSAYAQKRAGAVSDRGASGSAPAQEIPDYDDKDSKKELGP